MSAPARSAPATALPARTSGTRRGALAWALALLALAAAVLAALAVGRFPIAPSALPGILLGQDQGAAALVFWNIRLPRVLAAMLVGAALAAAGAAFQGMFRNPLASPDLLGVSAGASLGAVLGIFLGLPVAAIQGLAFAGGLGAVAGVAAVAGAVRGQGGDPVLVLILAGIALGALLGAAISLLKILADPYSQLPAITFWLLGSLAAATRDDLLAAAAPALLGLLGLLLLRWRLNLLTLGEDEARALGVETGLLRAAAVALATLCTAAVTALAGAVGWIGLVVPHMARLLGGPDLRRLVPLSMLLGAAFLLAVDTLARSAGRMEIPLGILTAVLGTPLFLWLLARARRGGG
jgi:iron complex transport system permease protein